MAVDLCIFTVALNVDKSWMENNVC